MTHAHAFILGLAAVLLTAACGNDDTSNDEAAADSGTQGSTEGERQALYHEDVRPILAEHCGTCHTEGAIAPFALDDYADTREWGEALLLSVQARTMPPFAVNNDGSCNEFHDARWLSEEEIDTLATWVEGGYPEGDDTLPAPDLPVPAVLSGSISELQLPEYQPVSAEAGGFEDYHCFLVDLELDEPRFVTGFDVVPGDPKLVHHVLGFRVDPSLLGNDSRMQDLDDESPDVPGWSCFGAAGEDVVPGGVPVTWAPGAGAISFPDGAGIRFDAGDVMVVQVHYDLTGGSGMDATQVHLSMAKEVEREAFQVLWDPFLFSAQFGTPEELDPGQESATYDWDETLREMTTFYTGEELSYDEVELIGLIPHMHERGKRMSIELETDAGMQCGADVDRWDFNWQGAYFYEQPIRMGVDDRLHVSCEWNTMADDQPILPGFGTNDEMCLVGVMFTPL